MKLKTHYETEAYVSAGGYYAIKQENWQGVEMLILLSKDQARSIRDDITAMLREDWSEEV